MAPRSRPATYVPPALRGRCTAAAHPRGLDAVGEELWTIKLSTDSELLAPLLDSCPFNVDVGNPEGDVLDRRAGVKVGRPPWLMAALRRRCAARHLIIDAGLLCL
jgi:hypothetical protein